MSQQEDKMSQQRVVKTLKGTELPLMDIRGKPYLQVQHRIMWFREDHPAWTIRTTIIHTDQDASLVKAEILDEKGTLIANGHKTETKEGFADHLEKAESSAIGRALGFLGYGTAFALDLEEGTRLADAPTTEVEKKSPIVNHAPASSTKPSSAPVATGKILGDYIVDFGKYKDRTLKELAETEGPFKISSYIQWLETDAKVKNKPMTDKAKAFIEAFDAFTGQGELDKVLDSKIDYDGEFDKRAQFDEQEPFPTEYPGR